MHRGLRLVAFGLDLMLALLTVLAFRLLLRFDGLQPGTPLFDGRSLGIVFLMLLLRDVLLPVSPAKWLLCLRLTQADGGPLPFLQRLLRAPLSLLPLPLLPRRIQERLWWRVSSVAPTSAGLVVRLAGTAAAALVSMGWAMYTFQPSIAEAEANRLARALVQGDPLLRQTLGEPIRFDVGHVARRAERVQPGTARFRLRLSGPQARQDMLVIARKVDGAWAIEELTDIQVVSLQRPGSDLAGR